LRKELVEVPEREFHKPRGGGLDGMRDGLLHGVQVKSPADTSRWNGQRLGHAHAMNRDSPERGDDVCDDDVGH